MKNLFIVANWKANKTLAETKTWIEEASKNQSLTTKSPEKQVVVCPPFTLLAYAANLVQSHNIPVVLGSQDVSPFEKGAFTGEEPAEMLKEFVTYTIIGHSERRMHFAESSEMIEQKVSQALQHSLVPILCVQGKETPVPSGVQIVAYEPISAIGTGNPDTPESADAVALSFKTRYRGIAVLYGGSVKAENVATFTKMPNIDGVLVGGASLDATSFISIVTNA